MIQFSSLTTPPFFVDGIAEIQVVAIKLLSTIFSKSAFLRKNIIFDLLNSLHRLPSSKNPKNCYRLSSNEYISNFTILILQLVQSVVKLPPLYKKSHAVDEGGEGTEELGPVDDKVVLDSYEEAKMMTAYFLTGFLSRCSLYLSLAIQREVIDNNFCRCTKAEEIYKRLFVQFLQELLCTLYRPEWPVSELLITVLGSILVKVSDLTSLRLILKDKIIHLVYAHERR